MKSRAWSFWLVPTLIFACSAQAQVERVAMRTTGVSCGTCAFFSEIYLKQLPGISAIKISLSQEAVMVTYKPGTAFRPDQLRQALKKTDVGVVQMQISARGHVERTEAGATLVAGRSRFKIQAPGSIPEIPAGVPILVEGILNDLATPMELKVLTFRAVESK